MKILQVAFKSEITGGEMVLWDLARGLKRAGHQVHVSAATHGPLLEEMDKEGFCTTVIPIKNTMDFSGARKLARYLRHNRIELVQSHGLLVNIISRIAAKMAGTPASISTEHCPNALKQGGHGGGFASKMKCRFFYRYLDNLTSIINKKHICVSETVRNDRLQQGKRPEKCKTIINGMDKSRFDFLKSFDKEAMKRELGLPLGKPLVGVVGRLAWGKDIATLVKAMQQVWIKVPDACLVVVGSGPEEERLKHIARGIGGHNKVFFTGFLPDAREAISLFDIFSLPTLWEGMPITIIEAMACGVPIVASRVDGVVEAVGGENLQDGPALTFPCGDVTALAHQLIRLLSDNGLHHKFSNSGKLRFEKHFSAERMIAETLQVYREITG